jgi:glyoxylase-like metal-dependent hydrolase (beta-lactamase superfamily II)
MTVDNDTTDPVRALGDDVFAIDTLMSGYDGITAAYLIRAAAPCLVETGTAKSADQVQRAVASLGVGPDDLATIAVTHIHLDHAGGVGDLARAFPRARIVVQESGAPHLVDPGRLLSSARRVFGASVVDDVFGAMTPTDAARIDAVGESAAVDLGAGRRLTALHSPGHARHHLGFVDEGSGDLYVGDAAGLYLPQTNELRPATPPPDFDLDLALASLDAFAARRPERLLFSHFGPVSDVAATLARSAEELRLWVDLAREARHHGLDLDHAVAWVTERTAQRYRRYLADPDLLAKFESLNSTAANLAGINHWLDRLEATPTGPGSTSPGG